MNFREQFDRPTEIIVVDDQPGICDFFATVLQTAGYRVEIAGDALSALGLLSRSPIALLITDLAMPGMDGLELIKRTSQRHPLTKMIAISGAVTHETGNLLDMAMQLGAERALVKPVTGEQLIQAVRDLIYPASENAAIA